LINEIRPGDANPLHGLKVLDLSQNNIKDISRIVRHCRKLTELYLISNSISSIPLDFYSSLKDLQHLHLSGNPITELHKDLSKLTNLKSLGISFTKIQQLPRSIVKLTQLYRILVDNTPLIVFF